ncbi:MAG: hypothetical protein ACI9UA_005813, partial [Pseudoalteromonas tetraodonis]
MRKTRLRFRGRFGYGSVGRGRSAKEDKGNARKPPSFGGLRSRVYGCHLVLKYLCFR